SVDPSGSSTSRAWSASRITVSPSSASSACSPSPTTSGRPSARAMIAACEVAEPSASAIPQIVPPPSWSSETSAGPRSLATRIAGHQTVRLDDLRLVEKAGVAQARGGPAELLCHLGERVQGPLALALPAGPRRVRLGVAQHERLGHGDASRRGESSEDAFHHCPSE